MTAPVTEEAPVDSEDDDLDHVACRHAERTWCGIDASGLWVDAPALERVCRVCLLAFEMYRPGAPCPVCGCHACVE